MAPDGPLAAFTVWAPRPTSLALDDLDCPGGAIRRQMVRTEDGTWSIDRAPLDRYWLVVDGERRPDPRSPRQSEGFDGPSAVDDGQFAWTDAAWRGRRLGDCVLYEVHVGAFSQEGTFTVSSPTSTISSNWVSTQPS